MRSLKREVSWQILCSCIALCSAPTVAADSGAAVSPDSTSLAEITVTAQRREESLEKTPVAVEVLGEDLLAKSDIVSEADLSLSVPGLSVRAGLSSNQLNYAMRGQSQDAFSGTRPGVLPYFNEVQIGGAGGSSTFYDIQSIQVLKGPQGTLFGRSATGGAVLFATAKPTADFGGYVSAGGGDYGAGKVNAALNVPLIGDELLSRIAGFYEKRDGYQYNIYNDSDVGGAKRYGVRASLALKLAGGVTSDLVVDYFNANDQNMVGLISGFDGAGNSFIPIQLLYGGTVDPVAAATGPVILNALTGAGLAASTAFYNAYFTNPKRNPAGITNDFQLQQARGPFVIDSDGFNAYRASNLIITETTAIELGDHARFKNIFGLTHLNTLIDEDADGTAYGISQGGTLADPEVTYDHVRQISDELQLLGDTFAHELNYVTGVYLSDEKARHIQNSDFFDILFGGETQLSDYTITNRTAAAYGQGTYDLSGMTGINGLGFTLGARYTSERVGKSLAPDDSTYPFAIDGSTDPTTGIISPPSAFSDDQATTYNRLSWQVGMQDQITSNLLTYIVSRRAYKSGGYNGIVAPRIGLAGTGGDAYLAEKVTDIEVGLKTQGQVYNSPFRFNVALYNNWVDNSQRTAFAFVSGNIASLTVNVPEARIYGAEFDGDIKPLNWLTLGGTLNLTHPRFVDGHNSVTVLAGPPQVFGSVPDTPERSGSLYSEVSIPIVTSVAAILRADVYAQSASDTSSQTNLNRLGTVLAGYGEANFRIGLEDKKAGWSVTANIKNAFNHVYYAGGLPTGSIYQINTEVPAAPRTWLVEGRYEF